MGCKHDIQCGARTIIGVRSFTGCDKPESGLFINDVPGISLKNAAGIANEEIQTGMNLLNDVIRRGILLTFNDFTAKIGGAFSFNAVVETRKVKAFDSSVIAAAPLSRGLVVKRWRSEMAQIYVEELFIKSKNSGVGIVKIFDGSIVKTYNVDLLADTVVTVRTDYIATQEEISITMDDTTFGVYSGPILGNSYGGCCGGGANNGLFVNGWDGTKEAAKYYGIGVNASVRCYEENVICSLMPRMYFLFWYAAAREFFEEQLTTSRLNNITIFTKDRAEKNLELYTDKYNKAFDQFVPTIKRYLLKTKGDCIACNGSKYVQSTP